METVVPSWWRDRDLPVRGDCPSFATSPAKSLSRDAPMSFFIFFFIDPLRTCIRIYVRMYFPRRFYLYRARVIPLFFILSLSLISWIFRFALFAHRDSFTLRVRSPSIIRGNQISAFVEVFIPQHYNRSGSFQHRWRGHYWRVRHAMPRFEHTFSRVGTQFHFICDDPHSIPLSEVDFWLYSNPADIVERNGQFRDTISYELLSYLFRNYNISYSIY